MNEQYLSFCNEIQTNFDLLNVKNDPDFAKEANQFAYYGILFECRKNKKKIFDYLSTVKLNWIINIMKGSKEGNKRGKKGTNTISKLSISKSQINL